MTIASGPLENGSTTPEQAIDPLTGLNQRIAARVAGLRSDPGLSLEALAAFSGVSRSTLSLIECGETSATAVVLDKISAGLGVALAALFETERAAPGPLMRRAEQAERCEPASGYLRRDVLPPDHPSPLRIVEVEFPAGRRVLLEGSTPSGAINQQVWVLEGTRALTLGRTTGRITGRTMGRTMGHITHRLNAGDCLALHVDGPIEFHNPTRHVARYTGVIATGPPSRSASRQVPR